MVLPRGAAACVELPDRLGARRARECGLVHVRRPMLRFALLFSLVARAARGAEDADGPSVAREDSLAHWLMSTEWHWNGWRNVKFHAPTRDRRFARFWAPTADCEAGLCAWTANGSAIRVKWGDAGYHTLRAVSAERLAGARDADGAPCEARLVGRFEEELFGLDLYGILEADPAAPADELRRQFRRLALRSHPDKRAGAGAGDAAAATPFLTLHGAYDVLSDAAERARYDDHLARTAAAAASDDAVALLDVPRFVSEVERRAPGTVYIVVFTMGPSSPCGPCHDLRPVVRASAELLKERGVRFGSVHCDVAHLQGLCAEELEGRRYYPLIKVFGSDRARSASIIELRQSELPAAAVLHVCAELLMLLDAPAPARDEAAVTAKTPPWGVYSSTPLGTD